MALKKGEFSTNRNLLFIFSLTVSFLREERLEYCHIRIHSFSEMNTKDNPIK